MISHNKHLENLNLVKNHNSLKKRGTYMILFNNWKTLFKKQGNLMTLPYNHLKKSNLAKIHSNLINLGNHRVQVNN